MTWTLPITKSELTLLYKDKVDLSIFEREPVNDEDLIANFLVSKLWRLNNLYTIVDKDGERVNFRMNYAQHVVYAAVITHPRIIILKSRQQGISTFWLISYLDDALTLPDINVGLMAQGMSEASTLLKRTKLAWNTFPDAVRSFLQLSLDRDNSGELSWNSGSTLFIRTSFRSATLQRLHISEFGKIANKYPDRAMETKTGTLQAIRPGNPVVIESTAEGDNEFKLMWNQAVLSEAKIAMGTKRGYAGKDFMPVFLSWVHDPDCVSSEHEEESANETKYFEQLELELNRPITQEQRNFWISQYRELGESLYQEYPATPDEAFLKVNDGSYYGAAYLSHIAKKGRVQPNLYDSSLEVFVAMDLGMNDTFSMVYFQKFRTEWRVVDEYENSGEGLEFYVNQMKRTGYTIDRVICPHDVNVTELGSGKSRKARLHELGVTNITVLPRTSIEAGIEQVRKAVTSMWLDEKCVATRGALQNYTKEWDDKHGVWKNKPIHDKWSHMADAIRYMVMSNAEHKAPPVRTRSSVQRGGFEI